MRLAVDSSALAKRYIQEWGSNRFDDILLSASDLALCIIIVPELISGLNRRLLEGALNETEYRKAKTQMLEDVHDATILQLTPGVISLSVSLLENHSLRAMDALHIACALEWKADLFVTSDKKQFEDAVRSGLRAQYLGKESVT